MIVESHDFSDGYEIEDAEVSNWLQGIVDRLGGGERHWWYCSGDTFAFGNYYNGYLKLLVSNKNGYCSLTHCVTLDSLRNAQVSFVRGDKKITLEY